MGALSKDAKPAMAKGSERRDLRTPQNALASRVQSLLLKQAAAAGQTGTIQLPQTVRKRTGESFPPGTLSSSSTTPMSLAAMVLELIFKPPKAAWITRPPCPKPSPITRGSRYSALGDRPLRAPAIAKTIEGLDRCASCCTSATPTIWAKTAKWTPAWSATDRSVRPDR